MIRQISKKRIEDLVVILSIAVPILIFLIFYKTPLGMLNLKIENFLDNYLFGNGYYKPSNYPVPAKIANSVSVVLTAISGLGIGLLRKNDFKVSKIDNLNMLILFIIMPILIGFAWYLSIFHQEFKNPRGRSFGLTESFHNDPFWFLFLLSAKGIVIYLGFRMAIPLGIYGLRKSWHSEKTKFW